MRDHGIAYGFSQTDISESLLRSLTPNIKAFLDQHPELLHEEANVSWLFDGEEGPSDKLAPSTPEILDDQVTLRESDHGL